MGKASSKSQSRPRLDELKEDYPFPTSRLKAPDSELLKWVTPYVKLTRDNICWNQATWTIHSMASFWMSTNPQFAEAMTQLIKRQPECASVVIQDYGNRGHSTVPVPKHFVDAILEKKPFMQFKISFWENRFGSTNPHSIMELHITELSSFILDAKSLESIALLLDLGFKGTFNDVQLNLASVSEESLDKFVEMLPKLRIENIVLLLNSKHSLANTDLVWESIFRLSKSFMADTYISSVTVHCDIWRVDFLLRVIRKLLLVRKLEHLQLKSSSKQNTKVTFKDSIDYVLAEEPFPRLIGDQGVSLSVHGFAETSFSKIVKVLERIPTRILSVQPADLPTGSTILDSSKLIKEDLQAIKVVQNLSRRVRFFISASIESFDVLVEKAPMISNLTCHFKISKMEFLEELKCLKMLYLVMDSRGLNGLNNALRRSLNALEDLSLVFQANITEEKKASELKSWIEELAKSVSAKPNLVKLAILGAVFDIVHDISNTSFHRSSILEKALPILMLDCRQLCSLTMDPLARSQSASFLNLLSGNKYLSSIAVKPLDDSNKHVLDLSADQTRTSFAFLRDNKSLSVLDVYLKLKNWGWFIDDLQFNYSLTELSPWNLERLDGMRDDVACLLLRNRCIVAKEKRFLLITWIAETSKASKIFETRCIEVILQFCFLDSRTVDS